METIKLKYLTSLKDPYPIGDGDHGQIKPDDYLDEGIPYIRVQNLSFSNKIDNEGMVFISDRINKKNSKSILKPNDILVAKTGATIGKAAVLPESIKIANTTSSVGKITVDRDKADPNYVYFCIASDPIQKKIWEIASTKSAQPGFNIEDIKEFKIYKRTIENQIEIANFLTAKCSAIEDMIKKEEDCIDYLRKYKISAIDSYCVDDKFEIKKLKYVAKILRGGSPRPIDDFLTDNSDGYNWIKIGDAVKGSKYINATSQKITKSGLSKTRLIRKGDLILSNSMSFGQPYILNIDGCIHDGWLVFSDLSIDVNFLYYSLMTSKINLQFKKAADGGVVQNLNINKVGDSLIYVPDINKQKEIVKTLDSICENIEKLIRLKEEKIETLKLYKKSLIYECVTGKKEIRYA